MDINFDKGISENDFFPSVEGRAMDLIKGYIGEINDLSESTVKIWKSKVLASLEKFIGEQNSLYQTFNKFSFTKYVNKLIRKGNNYTTTDLYAKQPAYCKDIDKVNEVTYILTSVIDHIKNHGIYTTETNSKKGSKKNDLEVNINEKISVIPKLKERIDDIERLGVSIQTKYNIEDIVPIDEYHDWRIQAEDLFSEFFDESNVHYKDFISHSRGGNGYVLINYFSVQYPLSKLLLTKIKTQSTIMPIKKELTRPSNTGRDIFISHASMDTTAIIEPLIDLITSSLAVTADKIFCSTTDGTKIESGLDWRNDIKDNLISAKINLIIITPNYKESEVCQNEMGAAWVCSAKVRPFILEPINYGTVGVIHKPLQVEKLLDGSSLDRLKDLIQLELGIDPKSVKSDRWTLKKKEFIEKVKSNLSANKFREPMDRELYDKNIKNLNEQNAKISILEAEISEYKRQIDSLKSLKDKEAVKAVEKSSVSFSVAGEFQEFQRIVSEIKKELKDIKPYIAGLIYIEFTRKGIVTMPANHSSDIGKAIGRGFLTAEAELNEDSFKIKSILKLLEKLKKFMNSESISEQFDEDFLDTYECDIDISITDFWREVFNSHPTFD